MPARFLLLFCLLLPSFSHAEEGCVCRYCQGLLPRTAGNEPGEVSDGRKYAPDRLVDVQNIKIDVTPNFERRTLAAETTLTFTPISRSVRVIELDAVDLRIESITGTPEVAEWDNDGWKLTILFKRPLTVGQQAELTFRYTAQPEKGLYFRTKELGYPDGDMHLWTQGETHEARHWFPCFDYPNERSTTEVICRVDPELTVLSNGRVVSEKIDDATGLKAVHWRMDKPHVNYLVCLAAGRFAKLEDQAGDIPLGFYSQPSLAEHAKNAFADTAQIMKFYQQEIGVPYPWPKYDQVTIRDFTSGGMENTTLTTLTHRTIYSDETEELNTSRDLDAHEMAHQWFGDYVTCEDWANLWLNEGFATYYTHLYRGRRLGHDHLLYGLWRDAQSRVLSEENDTRPIVYRGYKSTWEQFDFRAYPKGSWVLHMLRNQLGKDAYRRAIKSYLEKHALSSVSTPDLIAELEDASGQSLDRFFDQWVYHGGFPKVTVSHQWLPEEKLARVTLKQTQATSDKVLLFHLPVTLRFVVNGVAVDQAVEFNEKEQEYYFPLAAKPELVRFDPAYSLLAEVKFSKSQPMLEKQLQQKDDLIGRLIAVEELGQKKNEKSVAALKAALNEDPFYGVRSAAAKAFGSMQTDEAYQALVKSMQQDDARARIAVVEAIGRYYRAETEPLLLRVAQREKNPEIAAAAIKALAAYHTPEAHAAIRAAMKRSNFQNSLPVAAVQAAARSAEPALAADVLNAIATRRHELTDRGLADALVAAGKLARGLEEKTPARQLLEAELNAPALRVRTAAAEALGELGDPRSIAALEGLAESGPGRDLASTAKTAIEKIQTQAPLTPREVGQLRQLVRELQGKQKKLESDLDALQKKSDAKGKALPGEE